MFKFQRFIFALFITILFANPAFSAINAKIFEALLTSQRSAGATLASGKAYFYVPGTTTLKTIYADRNKSTAAANPYTLSSDGTAEIYGDGLYDVKITNAAGVQKYYWDDVKIQELVGETYDNVLNYASLPNAVSTIGATKTTLIVGNDQTLTDSLTIPANIGLRVINGAIIEVAAGKTLTINGSFSSDGIAFTSSSRVAGLTEIYPQWFNSVINGVVTVYVSPTGNNDENGLTIGTAKLTMQGAFDLIKQCSKDLFVNRYKIQLAAGTYTGASSLVGVQSLYSIEISGPDFALPNVPTVIISNSGLNTDSSKYGMYLQKSIFATVKNIRFHNWYIGLQADGDCDLYTEKVNATSNYYAAVSVDNGSQLRMKGGIIDGSTFYGVRLYSQTTASVGYSGTSVGDSTLIKNCGTGVFGSVSSRVHVDYANLLNNDVGLFTEKNSRSVANYTAFTDNDVAVRTEQNSIYGESGGGTNTFTNNTKNYIAYGSNDDISTYQTYWDRETGRWLYGASAYRTPITKYEWQLGTASSGSAYNTGISAVFDNNDDLRIGLSAPADKAAYIVFSKPGASQAAMIYFDYATKTMRIEIDGETVETWTDPTP